jgi:uncharacterized protein
MNALAAAVAGLLFATGLAMSGMTSPARVLGFLDVRGDWDPQLVFVMCGAVVSYAVLYWLIRRNYPRPLLDTHYHVPELGKPDRKLVLGAALFGVGWGLMGLCPGPALVSAGAGKLEALGFVGAMALGMLLVNLRARAHRGA